MAGTNNEATHSLRTQIQTIFNTEGAIELKNQVDAVSSSVKNMVEPVNQLTDAFNKLGNTPLKDLAKTLKDFTVDSVTVDAQNLRKVIEKKIATAIAKSRIEFVDEGTRENPFKVQMPVEFWEKNYKNIAEALAKAFTNFEPDTTNIPPLDTSEIVEEFQKKFNEQIIEMIKNENIFSLYTIDPKTNVKKYKYKRKFQLDKEAVNTIIETIEKRFIEVLSDPNNIEFSEVPKIRLKSEGLKQVIKRIEESVGEVDKHLDFDVDALKDLPNIQDKLVNFRSGLSKMVKEINELAKQLDSITFGKATEEDIQKALEVIMKLKESTISQLNKWLEDIAISMNKNFSLKPDLAGLEESIVNLRNYFNDFLQSELNSLMNDLESIYNAIKPEGIDKKDVLKGKKIDVTQILVDTIKQSILDYDVPLKVDMKLVDDVLMQWSGDLNEVLSTELNSILDTMVKLFNDLFVSIDSRIDAMFRETENEILLMIDENASLINIDDLKKLLQSVEQKIFDYIVDVLDKSVKINFETGDIEFNPPKTFTRNIKKVVEQNIQNYINKILEGYNSQVSGEGLEEVSDKLNKHSNMIINAVMRRVNQTLTDIRMEFLHRNDGLDVSTVNLRNIFEKNVKELVSAYIKVLESSVQAILLTEDSLNYLIEQFIQPLKKNLTSLKINVDKSDLSVKLDEAYRIAVEQIGDSLINEIKSWMPETYLLSEEDLINIPDVIEKVKSGINSIIDNCINSLATNEFLNLSFDDIKSRIVKDIENVIKIQVENALTVFAENSRQLDGINISSVNFEKIVRKIDSVLGKILLNRFAKVVLEKIPQENIKINISGSLNRVLKQVEVVVNNAIEQAVNSLTNVEIGDVKLNIKTARLQNNIDRLIQKIINEKSKQITILGNQLIDEIGVNEGDIEKLKESLVGTIDHVIASYQIATERLSSGLYSTDEINKIYQKMVNGILEAFTQVVDSFINGLSIVNNEGIAIAVNALHPNVRKAIAESFGMSVSELKEKMPEIKGNIVQKTYIQKNVETIMRVVNDLILSSIKNVISFYEESAKQIEIAPDKSLVEYIENNLRALQDTIISQAKKMVKEQFRYLTEEIKGMNLEARSLGYKPTKAFYNEVARATGKPTIQTGLDNANISANAVSISGTDVVAQGLKVEGNVTLPEINQLKTNAGTIVVNGEIVDFSIERLPLERSFVGLQNLVSNPPNFENTEEQLSRILIDIRRELLLPNNVFKSSYRPFNINDILYIPEVGKKKGFLEGVAYNVAKYILAGYTMRLPIKALSAATSVASKLDYYIAKARQDILIKDPEMISLAREIVYESFKAANKSVDTEEFRKAVEKEAINLKNIMNEQMQNYLLNIAKAYYRDIDNIGRYYSIVSRREDNPYASLTKTREIAKMAAVEDELDVEFAAEGMDALAAQWGIQIGELNRYTNMLLKTAMLSNVTVTDLLMAQRDTAAMFKERLQGLDSEKAFASAMALTAMFVEATGKSGREAGTFFRNILQRPYVKDTREFLERASQIRGFEMLSPYEVDEMGRKVQKDFVTMFSNILEATLKVDDPSAMTILSEVFPIRTIGGAESMGAFIQNLRNELERTVEILKEMGELGEEATLETVNIKDVIEKYVENIMNVTEEDIGMYIAGLQDTIEYAYSGMNIQFQSTVYNIFKEMKEEFSSAMTYLTSILRFFEKHSDHLAEVIRVFMKIGVGLLGSNIYRKIVKKGESLPVRPTEVQEEMVNKYMELQALEKSADLRRTVLKSSLENYKSQLEDIFKEISFTEKEKAELEERINLYRNRRELTYDEIKELSDLEAKRDIHAARLLTLEDTRQQLEKTIEDLTKRYEVADKEFYDVLHFGKFLSGSLGARNVEELKNSFANYLREEVLYSKVAPFVLRSRAGFDDEYYTGIFNRKTEIENELLTLQKEMLRLFKEAQNVTTDEELRTILGKDFGDSFYAIEHRVDENTKKALDRMSRYMEFDKQYAKLKETFDKTYKELNAINSKIIELNNDRLELERAIFEAERNKIIGYQYINDKQIPVTAPKTPREKVEVYRSILPAFGVNINEFESGMDKLAAMFKDGKLDVDQYESSLREVAVQLGIADRDFAKFKETIRQLNDEIRDGNLAIYQYISALEAASTKAGKLQLNNLKNTASISNANVGQEVGKGLDTATKVTIGIGALSAISKGTTSKGILGKLLGIIAGTKVGSAAMSLFSKFGATKFGAGLLAGLKSISFGKLAIIYLLTSVLGSALGGFAERGMTDAERLSLEANKLETQINKATSWKINKDDGSIKKLFKGLAIGLFGIKEAIFNQINRITGGTAPSFGETIKIWMEAFKNQELTRDELRTRLKEELDVNLKRARANYMRQQEYLSKNPFVNPITGELRKPGDEYLLNLSLEELMEFLQNRMNDLNKALSESDALFTKEKVRLLVSGISENSSKMREVVEEYLDRNIEEMELLLEEFKEYLTRLVPGTETYDELQMRIYDLETKISEAQLKKFETQFSAYNEIMEKYNRNLSLIQSKYDIQKYSALLAGISEDSSAIRQIEKKMAAEQVRLISSIQSSLESLKQEFKDKPEQAERILIEIQQLEAEKKRILADIKNKMSETLSTFNLPSEIQPISYYEAMTRNNTHRNVTIRSGDAIVNVTISNMTGSEEDLEKLGRVVSQAVAQAQKNFVRQFANDVKAGMGNNYYSWNQY